MTRFVEFIKILNQNKKLGQMREAHAASMNDPGHLNRLLSDIPHYYQLETEPHERIWGVDPKKMLSWLQMIRQLIEHKPFMLFEVNNRGKVRTDLETSNAVKKWVAEIVMEAAHELLNEEGQLSTDIIKVLELEPLIKMYESTPHFVRDSILKSYITQMIVGNLTAIIVSREKDYQVIKQVDYLNTCFRQVYSKISGMVDPSDFVRDKLEAYTFEFPEENCAAILKNTDKQTIKNWVLLDLKQNGNSPDHFHEKWKSEKIKFWRAVADHLEQQQFMSRAQAIRDMLAVESKVKAKKDTKIAMPYQNWLNIRDNRFIVDHMIHLEHYAANKEKWPTRKMLVILDNCKYDPKIITKSTVDFFKEVVKKMPNKKIFSEFLKINFPVFYAGSTSFNIFEGKKMSNGSAPSVTRNHQRRT
jgi:hypothetical protein